MVCTRVQIAVGGTIDSFASASESLSLDKREKAGEIHPRRTMDLRRALSDGVAVQSDSLIERHVRWNQMIVDEKFQSHR